MNPEAKFSGYLRLFKNKDFTMIWVASVGVAVSQIAMEVTVTWSTWESTKSATAIGLLISAISLPKVILETLIGCIVDSYDRRKLMIVGSLGTSALSLALSVLARESAGGRVLGMIAIIWMLPAFQMLFSRARSSLLPRLISDQATLVSAQALLKTTTEGIFVMSGIAAVLMPIIGRVPIMIAGIAMAIVASLAAGQLSPADKDRVGLKALSFFRMLRNPFGEPLMTLKNNRFLAWFVALVALSNIPHNAITAMVLPLSVEKTGLGVQGYGIVEIALSLGVIVGYLLAGRLLSLGDPVKWSIAGLGWSALVSTLIALSSETGVIIALFGAYGMSEGFFLPGYAKFDLEVQDSIRGAINALFNVIALLLTPVAQIGAGALSDRFGPSALYSLSGLALFVVGIIAVIFRPGPVQDTVNQR